MGFIYLEGDVFIRVCLPATRKGSPIPPNSDTSCITQNTFFKDQIDASRSPVPPPGFAGRWIGVKSTPGGGLPVPEFRAGMSSEE